MRTLQEHVKHIQEGGINKDGDIDLEAHTSNNSRVTMLVSNMVDESKSECQRVGAWGITGEGTGGRLVRAGNTSPMKREQLFGKSRGSD